MRVGSLSSETTFTLGNVAGQRGRTVELVVDGGDLYAKVVAPGMMLIVQ